mmetsp:Transcript_33547/g.53803  ORF Transcript_33547/g.53803 Transcript_33547/m.53803 type:complete len:316 (+) Transcript_33547:79-1026(+)
MWASRSGLQLVSSRAAAAARADARRVAHVDTAVCTILRGARRASAAGRRRGGGGRGSIGDEFAAILGATVTLSSSSAHSGTSARAGARLLASWPDHPRRLATARTMSTAGGGGGDGDSWIGGGVASLEQWLRHHGVDPAQFGSGAAKTTQDLVTEVEQGETTLEVIKGSPRRNVRVLQLLVLDARGRMLIEASQEWEGGRMRERNQPLSEKLLGGEDWRQAAPRAVAEELGSALTAGYTLHLDESTLRCEVVERDSLSYPGLPSRYVMNSVEARIDNGFPCTEVSGDFEGFTSVEETKRGRLTVRWEWREGYTPA